MYHRKKQPKHSKACDSSCYTSSHPSLLHLPGPLTHPVLSSAGSRSLRPEHQTQPGQLWTVPLQVALGVSLQLVHGPGSALVQRHHGAQHGVEAEVDVWSQQVVQEGVDPFGVGGAADQAADFGPQAGGGAGGPLSVVIAAGAKGQDALEGLIGPQQAALVDGQGTRIVHDNSSILQRHTEIQIQKVNIHKYFDCHPLQAAHKAL